MPSDLLAKLRRGLKKPPRYIVERLLHEVQGQAERHLAPIRASRTKAADLARAAGHPDVSTWWSALAARAYATETTMQADALDRLCPGDRARIIGDAERALAREVDMLGSGLIRLGTPIDWHADYKTGHRWQPRYCRDIEYSNLDQPSDVKFPWELSRMQWLIPAGQAYALTGEERYAEAVCDIIGEWIAANPYAMSVNWACTMDVALRAMTWTWLFHVFSASSAWSEPVFRERFLSALWLHGDFTSRHLEQSDINGNHFTADAAGLVFLGLFFGGSGAPERWLDVGWGILLDELPRQVFDDGVDFEASVPYHRLVQELFLLPVLYRMKHGLDVPGSYRQRLVAMARFTQAYSRPDGSVPLWGDADDARALPFRQKPINDHRYLLAITGVVFGEPDLVSAFSGPRSEPLWVLGADLTASLPDRDRLSQRQRSVAFSDGGFYILANDRDHVFVDCGPLGIAGRGGHGHNDLLSFEAVLDGAHLVSDCGAYLYTANAKERNAFRSTAYHNSPRIDGQEINRLVRPDYLWSLHNDAAHEVLELAFGPTRDRLRMRHTGYMRLASPVGVERTIALDHASHRLSILDELTGAGEHTIEIPLHLAPGVIVSANADRSQLVLIAQGRRFDVAWSQAANWQVEIAPARVSPTYGTIVATERLCWRRSGPLVPLCVTLSPSAVDARP